MNVIFRWFYQFCIIRKIWWRVKKWRKQEFNDRETIQYVIDHKVETVFLPNEKYLIDHTLYLNSGTILQGTYHLSKPKANQDEG